LSVPVSAEPGPLAHRARAALGVCAVGCAGFVAIGKAPFNLFFWCGVLAFCVLAAADRRALGRGLREPVVAGALALFALYAASLLWTAAPLGEGALQLGSYRVLAMPLVFLPVLVDPVWRERALRALLVALGVVLVLSLVQAVHPLPFARASRDPFGILYRDAYVFSDRIRQAIQLGPLLLWAAGMAIFHPGSSRRLRLGLAAVAVVTAIDMMWLLKGRTGTLVVSGLLLYLLHARFGARGLLGAVVGVAAVLAAGLWMNARLGETLSDIDAYRQVGANNATGERLEMWRNAAQMLADAPLLGAGIEAYPVLSAAAYAARGRVPAELFHDPHQEFLYVGAELGLVGLALLLGGLIGIWRIAARFDARWRWLARGFVAIYASAGLANCLLNLGWTGYLFGLLLALVAGRHAQVRAEQGPERARSFVVVRHDNLGDVALALPMAGLLKRARPDCTVFFAVRRYAQDVAAASRHVDGVVVVTDEAAFERDLRALQPDAVIFAFPSASLARAAARAGVPIRVGTARRWYHWRWCTLRPFVRRSGSSAHEAQLDLRLLAPFVADTEVPREALWRLAGLAPERAPEASDPRAEAPAWPLRAGVANVLLQVRSNGNGKEWPLRHYLSLIESLPADRFNFIVNGTPAEGDALREAAPALFALPQVTDATRGFTIPDLLRTLPRMDAVLSNSTGPMHLAALSGAPTLGLFVDLPGMDPARWGPLGPHAGTIVAPSEACVRCPRGAPECPCMAAIAVDRVVGALEATIARR
jgi:ADP-heptose:LPS heptosyltransferase/O-antigen ligase